MQAEQCFVRTYDLLGMMRPQRSDNSSGTTPDEACAAAQPKSQYASERCANSKRCLEAMQEVTGRELRASHTHIPRPRHADKMTCKYCNHMLFCALTLSLPGGTAWLQTYEQSCWLQARGLGPHPESSVGLRLMYGCMPISPETVEDAESLITWFPPFRAASAT